MGVHRAVSSVQWTVRKPNKLAVGFRVDFRFDNSFYPKDTLPVDRSATDCNLLGSLGCQRSCCIQCGRHPSPLLHGNHGASHCGPCRNWECLVLGRIPKKHLEKVAFTYRSGCICDCTGSNSFIYSVVFLFIDPGYSFWLSDCGSIFCDCKNQ